MEEHRVTPDILQISRCFIESHDEVLVRHVKTFRVRPLVASPLVDPHAHTLHDIVGVSPQYHVFYVVHALH